MLQSWPHVDFTGPSHAQSHVSYQDDWSRTTLAGPKGDHEPFPSVPFSSVPFQTQTWDRPSQECKDSQHILMGADYTPRPGPMTVAMPHGNVLSPYDIGMPALDEPGAYQFTNTARSGAVSQRPNHCVDPIIWTPSPYATCCPNTVINPETVSSWAAEANTAEMMTGFYSRPTPAQGKQIVCYDHGCNGRPFSSISNLRRHQRERAGRTPLSFCCWCGAGFYRRWTRDHHVMRMYCLRSPRQNELVTTSRKLDRRSIWKSRKY